MDDVEKRLDGRIAVVEERLLDLMVSSTKDVDMVDKRLSCVEGDVSVVETRLALLEDEVSIQRGRLWALVMVIVSEVLVTGVQLFVG